ncbi:hypothetical protein C8R46DRAFT_1294721 [Mycena filopes]|nr:hypothetical protein C8R46DRAFT_1294721 [Mycena filopes]
MEPPLTHITSSIIPLLKAEILWEFGLPEGIVLKKHLILPAETAFHFPANSAREDDHGQLSSHWVQSERVLRSSEALLVILVEYLDQCDSVSPPYNAAETLQHLASAVIPKAAVHPDHQIRLATAIHRVFDSSQSELTALLDAVISGNCWSLYAKGLHHDKIIKYRQELQFPTKKSMDDRGLDYPWLENPLARQRIKDVFAEYGHRRAAEPDKNGVGARLKRILAGFDSWHRDVDDIEGHET